MHFSLIGHAFQPHANDSVSETQFIKHCGGGDIDTRICLEKRKFRETAKETRDRDRGKKRKGSKERSASYIGTNERRW